MGLKEARKPRKNTTTTNERGAGPVETMGKPPSGSPRNANISPRHAAITANVAKSNMPSALASALYADAATERKQNKRSTKRLTDHTKS